MDLFKLKIVGSEPPKYLVSAHVERPQYSIKGGGWATQKHATSVWLKYLARGSALGEDRPELELVQFDVPEPVYVGVARTKAPDESRVVAFDTNVISYHLKNFINELAGNDRSFAYMFEFGRYDHEEPLDFPRLKGMYQKKLKNYASSYSLSKPKDQHVDIIYVAVPSDKEAVLLKLTFGDNLVSIWDAQGKKIHSTED